MKTDSPYTPYFKYKLALADGNHWQLTGGEETTPAARKLASIMKLEKANGEDVPNIFFLKIFRSSGEKNGIANGIKAKSQAGFPVEQWRCYPYTGLNLWRHQSRQDVLWEVIVDRGYERQFILMQFFLSPIYQKSITLGGLPFHAALAEFKGKGVLLVGASNFGKTTCSQRLPDSWNSLCDDETLTVLAPECQYRAHPFPTWSDYILKRSEKKWKVEYSVPVQGIFFLKKDKFDKTVPVGKGQAAVLLNQSAMEVCGKFWRSISKEEKRDAVKKTFDNACNMAEKIPSYYLHFSRHGRFWEAIEEVL